MTITAEPIIGATNPFVFIATNTKGETVKNIRILPNKNLGSHTIATSKLYPSNVKTAGYSPQAINIPTHNTRVSVTILRGRFQNFLINSFVIEMGMSNMVLSVLSVYSLLNKNAAIATYIIMFTSSMIYSTLSLYLSDMVKIISGLSKCVCKASINIKSGVDNTPATLISTIFERFSFNNSQEIRLSNTATSNQFRKVVL